MRIPTPLAWLLLVLGFFTAGLLRRFHDGTPTSPWVSPTVGSLLFAAVFFLLLVAAWERRRGAVPGPGVRLGSVVPILLMLLIEKWTSLTLYPPVFGAVSDARAPADLLDAQFRLFAGIGLLCVCFVVAGLSVPAARKTWRRARPSRWPVAAVEVAVVIGGTYAVLGSAAWALGGGLHLQWPRWGDLVVWVFVGQAILALAEEAYYRGLLLCEMERLAPRLGVRSRAAGRWTALLPTSLLFGLEHVRVDASGDTLLRSFVFTVSLALLFGLLIQVSANLHLAAGVHAWINWLLLGAVPRFAEPTGEPALPAGTYIGLSLTLAFVLAYLQHAWRSRRRESTPAAVAGAG